MPDIKPPTRSLPNEKWLPVIGLEELYEVSSAGRIWSYHSQRLLKPTHGRRVVLAGRARAVPELVLEAHGGQPRAAAGMIPWPVDKTVPRIYAIENLKWVSRKEMLTILSRERAAKLAARRPDVELMAS
jgi:hypothetical protein